jgi:ADP-ribosylglycohydrolase
MLGLAIGDALGHPTTFLSSLAAIRERWGPHGVTTFVAAGKHPAGTFTDDTQMAIALARALVRTGPHHFDATLTAFAEELVAWSRSPLNNRAPSATCIAACRHLARGVSWRDAGVKGSKGASSATRVVPVGLMFHDDNAGLVRLAAAQSAVTHAHPTAVCASVAAAAAVAWATRGGDVTEIFAHCRRVVSSIPSELLVEVGCTPGVVAHIGAHEMLDALARAESLASQEIDDPCALFGDARVGEEAVACALWCVVRAGASFREAVLRAANSSGSSDMIAALAGAVAGAMVGTSGIDPTWATTVERAAVLRTLADALATVWETGAPIPLDPSTDLFGHDRLAVRPEDFTEGDDTEVDNVPEALRSFRLPTGPYTPAGRKARP